MPARLLITTSGAQPRPPGPIKSLLLTALVLLLAIIAFLIAIPLMIAVLVVAAIAVGFTRWRLRRRLRAELTRGRENVRVIRTPRKAGRYPD